jgi:hypothetical protein
MTHVSAGGFVKLALVGVFGAGLLVAGIIRFHDPVRDHGIPVVARVIEPPFGAGHGVAVTVRFTTTSGQPIVATVEDPPAGPPLVRGAEIAVRYDPDDPSHVVPANENQSAITRWFLVLSGALLLGLAGFGAWYQRSRAQGTAGSR